MLRYWCCASTSHNVDIVNRYISKFHIVPMVKFDGAIESRDRDDYVTTLEFE